MLVGWWLFDTRCWLVEDNSAISLLKLMKSVLLDKKIPALYNQIQRRQRLVYTMRMRLRFTLIFAAKISHHSIDNNVNIFTQRQMHSVNGP